MYVKLILFAHCIQKQNEMWSCHGKRRLQITYTMFGEACKCSEGGSVLYKIHSETFMKHF